MNPRNSKMLPPRLRVGPANEFQIAYATWMELSASARDFAVTSTMPDYMATAWHYLQVGDWEKLAEFSIEQGRLDVVVDEPRPFEGANVVLF